MPTYDFAKISKRKLHKIEIYLAMGGDQATGGFVNGVVGLDVFGKYEAQGKKVRKFFKKIQIKTFRAQVFGLRRFRNQISNCISKTVPDLRNVN